MDFRQLEVIYFFNFCLGFLFILSVEHSTVLSSLTQENQTIQDSQFSAATAAAIEENKNKDKPKCIDKTEVSEEKFRMRMNLCRKNVSISCEIGSTSDCFKDQEAFKATAFVSKEVTECLIEANTTELKYIRFIVKAKYIKNLNQLGSRSLGGAKEKETQRGRCTLGYTCVDNTFLQEVNVKCHAFHYDAADRPLPGINGTKFDFKWFAPPNYQGSLEFGAVLKVSYDSFFVDVSTARLYIPNFKYQN